MLIFCDERAGNADPVAALSALKSAARPPLAVLIGPEGGFTDEEREHVAPPRQHRAAGARARAFCAPIPRLWPRSTLVQSVLGDWRD